MVRLDFVPPHHSRKERTMNRVPEAPSEQVSIPQEDLQRLEEWISYFERLSPRIKLFRRTDAGVPYLLSELEKEFRKKTLMDDDQKIVGWPTVSTMAFMIQIDSSLPGLPPLKKLNDVRFFCFDDRAFAPNYFRFGDNEYVSLEEWTSKTLSWDFIRARLEEELVHLESRVPKLRK